MDVIETERLVLRHQTEDDAPFVLGLMNDPDWLRHIGDRGVRTVADARAYIRDGAVAMYAQHGIGLYLVEAKRRRVPVGVCGLLRRATFDDVDLGFALAPEHRGRGYAREAAAATVAYGRDVLGLDRIAAIVSPGNAASVRLLEGLGFAFERPFTYPDGDAVQLFALDL
ncbi:MAG: GNAT family N-acetyltransferase [Rhodothermales bacterium]